MADRLTRALIDAGIGHCAWRGLKRTHAVPKSSTAASHDRPSVELHYESFDVMGADSAPEHIVLIDDVVTKGRTLLAASWRLHERFPTARISAFALLRTLGHVDDIAALIAPCRGEIRWLHGDAYRSP